MKKITAIITLFFLICLNLTDTADAARVFQAQLTYDGAVHDYTGAYFTVVVNGQEVESPIPPIVLESGRSIVAVREIFESLGAEVLWAPGSPSRVYICYDGDIVSLTIDDRVALVNGRRVEMEVPAKIIAYNDIGKTMVPVRFVAETLGMEVDVDGSTDTISIHTPEQPATPTPAPPPATPTPTPTLTPTPTPEAKTVESLSASLDGNTLTAVLSLSAPLDTYNTMTLNGPNRVVLDLTGFSAAALSASYPAGGNTERIRTGEYEGSARIVFDVVKIPEYDVTVSEDKRTVTVTLTAENPPAVSGPKIVIDAGHGGSDPGAIGYNNDGSVSLQEKDATLPIANQLYEILRENGVDAYYTRNTDVYVTLAERAEFANSIGASLFVSVHCNAFTTTDVQGSLVMHHTSKDTSAYGVSGQDLANNILKYLPDALGTQNRGRVDGSAMYVIRKVDMPSVIVETAFITNPSDRAKLADPAMQEKAAQAIAQGILDTIPYLTK